MPARRRTPLLLAALAGLVLAVPAAPGQSVSLSARKHQVDSRISGLRAAIEEAKKKEGVLSDEIAATSDEIETLEGKIAVLSDKLALLEAELGRHRDRLARLADLYREQSRKLARLVREHAAAQKQLEQRLVELYQTSEVDQLEILLRVRTLTELIEQLDYANEIGLQDQRIADELERLKLEMRDARERTARTKAAVAEETAVLAAKTAEEREARAQLVAQESALAEARSDKRSLLVTVRRERHDDQEDLAAMQAASANLAARIQAAQAAASAASGSASGGGSEATPSASGFIWPVSGPVTSGFGWRWGRMHEGIDIGAGSGTTVHAAAAGTVIVAGWMGGYGNLVVIDHGGGLATAYAHLSAIYAGGGTVEQGQAVGAVGCTGHCFGSHLHFEVRVNGAAVDPLGYL